MEEYLYQKSGKVEVYLSSKLSEGEIAKAEREFKEINSEVEHLRAEVERLNKFEELVYAMRQLNIEEGYMTLEQLEVSEQHAVDYYRERLEGESELNKRLIGE
jgi:molecular chaperone DnaK (HSP70)